MRLAFLDYQVLAPVDGSQVRHPVVRGRHLDDLDALYRATRVMTGAETPEDIPGLEGPSDTACAAILAP